MDKTNVFHNVVDYSGKEVAPDGFRLSTITFKTPEKEKKNPAYVKPKNRCVAVPIIKVSVQPDVLQEALQEAFCDLQDAVIRKLIVDGDDAKKAKLTVSDDEISFIAVSEYAKLAAVSGKLSAESVEMWFMANISEPLTVALANALKYPDKCTPEQSAKLDAAIEQHKKLFGSLTGHKVNLDRKTAVSLQKALLLNAEEDKVHRILARKLEVIITPPTQELLGL